jgi:hypothetical protein
VFAYEPPKTLTDVSTRPCRYADLRGAVTSGDYPTKEAWRECLTKVNLNKILVEVGRVVDAELSGVDHNTFAKLCESGVS